MFKLFKVHGRETEIHGSLNAPFDSKPSRYCEGPRRWTSGAVSLGPLARLTAYDDMCTEPIFCARTCWGANCRRGVFYEFGAPRKQTGDVKVLLIRDSKCGIRRAVLIRGPPASLAHTEGVCPNGRPQLCHLFSLPTQALAVRYKRPSALQQPSL